MGPLIDQELEHIDRRMTQLDAVNRQLNNALALYHSLMRGNLQTNVQPQMYGQQYPAAHNSFHPQVFQQQQMPNQVYGQTNFHPQVQAPIPSVSHGFPPQTSYQQAPVAVGCNFQQNQVPQFNYQMPGPNFVGPQPIPPHPQPQHSSPVFAPTLMSASQPIYTS